MAEQEFKFTNGTDNITINATSLEEACDILEQVVMRPDDYVQGHVVEPWP